MCIEVAGLVSSELKTIIYLADYGSAGPLYSEHGIRVTKQYGAVTTVTLKSVVTLWFNRIDRVGG